MHPIPGALDYMDYSAGALGMRYSNQNNPGGCIIDGVQDNLDSSVPLWEMVTGPQGTLTIVHGGQIDVGGTFQIRHYYNYQTHPDYTQCTGDSHEYGASGVWIVGVIWNTDPLYIPAAKLVLTQVEYYDPPGQALALAQARAEEEIRPLAVRTSSWPIPPVPIIAAISVVANPFRLKISGSGFRQGCSAEIDGTPVPKTIFKSQSQVMAKGSSLKAMVPKGVTVHRGGRQPGRDDLRARLILEVSRGPRRARGDGAEFAIGEQAAGRGGNFDMSGDTATALASPDVIGRSRLPAANAYSSVNVKIQDLTPAAHPPTCLKDSAVPAGSKGVRSTASPSANRSSRGGSGFRSPP